MAAIDTPPEGDEEANAFPRAPELPHQDTSSAAETVSATEVAATAAIESWVSKAAPFNVTPAATTNGQSSPVSPAPLSSDAIEDVFRALQRPKDAHEASAVCREWREVFESRTCNFSIIFDMRTARWEPCFRDVSSCSFVTAWHPGDNKIWILDDPSLCMPQHVRFTRSNPWFTPSLLSELIFSGNFRCLESAARSPEGKQIAGLIKRFSNLTSVSIPVTVTTTHDSATRSYKDEGINEALAAVATCRSLRSFRLQIRFSHRWTASRDDFDSFNRILTERLAEIFDSCPRLRSFHLQMDMIAFASTNQLPDLVNMLSLARPTSSPTSLTRSSDETITSSSSSSSSSSAASSSSASSSGSTKQPTASKHRLSHLSLPIHVLPTDLLSTFPYLRSLQLHLTCQTQPAVFLTAAPFSQLRMLQELSITSDADFRVSTDDESQPRSPSLSPDLFSGLENSLRKLTFNLRGAIRTEDDSLVFIPGIDNTSSSDRDAVLRGTVVLPDSIWALTSLEELETDLCSRGAVLAAARRRERQAQLERRTALRVLGFNEDATAAATATETATATATATTTTAATAGTDNEVPLDEPRFAGLQRLTSVTLTAHRWSSPPPSLRHLPNLTRLHMPVAVPSLSSSPGVGLWHLKSLKELYISVGDTEVIADQQQQVQQEQQERQHQEEEDREQQGGMEPQHDRAEQQQEGLMQQQRQQGQRGDPTQGQGRNRQPFLPTGLESLTIHGASYNGWCPTRWASPTITKLKLVNVEFAPVPEAECLFPNLRVFQAIESVSHIGALPNLRHMLERSLLRPETRRVAYPNLTFLHVDRPPSKCPIPPMRKLETLILCPLPPYCITLDRLSSFTSLRFLRLSEVGVKRGRTGPIPCPPKLRTLEIHQSDFSCLPKNFKTFQCIRKLRLINCTQIRSLPEYLVTFTRLTELTISGGRLKFRAPAGLEALLTRGGYKQDGDGRWVQAE